MVEVFRTNIDCETVANEIMKDLCQLFPNYKVNFDLEYCDRIMRIEGKKISVSKVISVLRELSFYCEVLE